MPVLLAETLEGRAVTLRLVRSPQPMAAVEVVLALVLLLQVSVDAEAASAQRGQHRQQRELMEREVVATAALLLLESVP